jgi:hypothetical protein
MIEGIHDTPKWQKRSNASKAPACSKKTAEERAFAEHLASIFQRRRTTMEMERRETGTLNTVDASPISTRRLSLRLHFRAPLDRCLTQPRVIEIPSALAFRSIVAAVVLNFAAISDAVAPFLAIAITSRSSFQVNRPGLRLPTIPNSSILRAGGHGLTFLIR